MELLLRLKGITLQLKRWDFSDFFGPNGAGKTSLISILAGLNDPSDGSVEVFGKTSSKTLVCKN